MTTSAPPDFTWLPDLASRSIRGAVIWSNDETFAEKENLISPGPAHHRPASFGHRGQIYDGWETRRRRATGHDSAIIRLGAPGVIAGVVIDTSWFTGNYPPAASLDAIDLSDYLPAEELAAHPDWTPLTERVEVFGDRCNYLAVDSDRRWTHVRLNIYPDGGVARLRVHGEARPDTRFLASGLDLAALENGGLVIDCSNRFYSSPQNLIMPGLARVMGDGWETSRRRDGGNDWVQIRLAGAGRVHTVEIDTSCFIGNSPGAAALRGLRDDGHWIELLPRTALIPDTRHQFPASVSETVSQVRLDIYPDGGLARLRLHGELA